MQQRPLGRTGRQVSAIGLGTWQLGADWGAVDPSDAREVLTTSVADGVTLFGSPAAGMAAARSKGGHR